LKNEVRQERHEDQKVGHVNENQQDHVVEQREYEIEKRDNNQGPLIYYFIIYLSNYSVFNYFDENDFANSNIENDEIINQV